MWCALINSADGAMRKNIWSAHAMHGGGCGDFALFHCGDQHSNAIAATDKSIMIWHTSGVG